jgi:hypothetical protein
MEKAKVVGFIPRILYKVFLALKEKFDPRPIVSNEEDFARQICDKMIVHPQSKLSFSPLSAKRIIKNESLNMYIVLESYTVHVINHVYSYSVYFQDTQSFNDLKELFDNTLEKTRENLELEIRSNIQHSLKKILDRLN